MFPTLLVARDQATRRIIAKFVAGIVIKAFSSCPRREASSPFPSMVVSLVKTKQVTSNSLLDAFSHARVWYGAISNHQAWWYRWTTIVLDQSALAV